MNIFQPTFQSTISSRNGLLSTLDASDFARLSPHFKEVPLVAHTVLHESEDTIAHIHFPLSGMVSLFAANSDGDIVETAGIGREGMIGAAVAFGIQPAFGRAVVQVSGTALRIPSVQMQRLADENAGIRAMAARAQEVLLVQAQQVAMCSVVHGVDARLARWLLQARDRIGHPTIPIIQESLAQMLGARRTTVNLVLRGLVASGLVRCRRGFIEILDAGGLKARSCDCYDAVKQQLERLTPSPNAAAPI